MATHDPWMYKQSWKCCQCECAINSVEEHKECPNGACAHKRCKKCPFGDDYWAAEVQDEVPAGTSENGLGTASDGSREMGSSDSGIDAGNE